MLTKAFAYIMSFALLMVSFAVDCRAGEITPDKKVFLVLGGGGLRGFAHVGVLKVLEREHIAVDGVVGTSIGSVIGGLYCAGISPEAMEKEGPRRFIKAFFTAPVALQALQVPFFLLRGKSPEGLYSGNAAAKCIDSCVSADKREISNLRPEFAAVTTDLVSGQTCVVTSGDLGKMIQASTAVPFVRRPVQVGDKLLVDGGVICNLPVRQARQLGADIVIAVDIDERINDIPVTHFQKKLGSITNRVIALTLAQIDQTQSADADVFIHPETTGIALFSKRPSDAERAIAAGERAAIAALPEIRAALARSSVLTDRRTRRNIPELPSGFSPSNMVSVRFP